MTAGAPPDQPGSSLPVGTVTFLLTDVEGSTRQWEAEPDAMAVAIARHYALLDDAIAAHNGVRPVEQGEGDSVVGAFARASDALAAAVDAQLALRPSPGRTARSSRCAWPSTPARPSSATRATTSARPSSAARGCARSAHGGQVLVSGATADLVGERLPPDATLADLGLHRLKDLGRPEHVFELRHPRSRHATRRCGRSTTCRTTCPCS